MNLKFEGYGLYVYQVACRSQILLFGIFINTRQQAMLVGSTFIVLFLTVLCFLLFIDFFMRSWVLCSMSILWPFVAFCVVLRFSTYGRITLVTITDRNKHNY